MDAPLRQLLRATSGNILVKGSGLAVTFLLSVLLARVLGAEGYGHFALVLSWGHLLSVPAVMGLDILLTRELAYALQRGDPGQVRLLHRRGYAWVTAAGLSFGLACAVWIGVQRPQSGAVLVWAAPLIPLLALLKLHQGALQGWNRPVLAQVPLLLLLPAGTLVLVLLSRATVGLDEARAVHVLVAAALLAAAAGSIWVLRLLRTQPAAAPGVPAPPPRRWLAAALPLASITLFGMFNEQAGVLMLGALSGPQEAGIFDMVRKLASLVPFVLLTTTAPLAPQIARLHAAGDHATLQRLLTRGTQLAFAGSVLVAGGLIVLGPWILELLGPGFEAGYGALILLCAAQIFNAAMGPVAVILNMAGHERDVLVGMVLSAGIHLAVGLALIPWRPLEGAAIALALNLLVWNGLLGWRVRRRLGVRPWLRWA